MRIRNFFWGVIAGLLIFSIKVNVLAQDGGLLISQIQISSERSTRDEFVVITNFSSAEIPLSGHKLAKKSETATQFTTTNYLFEFNNETILPGQSLKIASQEYVGSANLRFRNSTVTVASNNTIAILNGTNQVVDKVGMGEANDFEGRAIPNPKNDEIFARVNGIDTNNNFNDFKLYLGEMYENPNRSNLMITEVLPNPKDGDEWFELYNPTNSKIQLLGLKVCDVSGSARCYNFKNDEFINPFEYKIFTQTKTRITLNNDGDGLELLTLNDEIIFDTGDDYGDAEDGESYSLFGSLWKWTSKETPGGVNIFATTIEKEAKKVRKTSKKKASSTSVTYDSNEEDKSDQISLEKEVKGEKDNPNLADEKVFKVSQKVVGYFIIVLAVLIFCGYILWENKEKISEIFNKITRRNN